MLRIKDIVEGITEFYGSMGDGLNENWNDMIDTNKRLLERSIDLDYIDLVEEP